MDPFIALHKYFIWANRFRDLFGHAVAANVEAGIDPNRAHMTMVEDRGIYMSFWYSSLFVVIEGYKELGYQDAEVDGLLQAPELNLLRRYRNGVCHFQADYFDSRFMGFMPLEEPGTTVQWVHRLHLAFNRFFLAELERHRIARAGQP